MNTIYSADEFKTLAHRLQVVSAARFLAMSDWRITDEVISSALALYDFELAEGWTYDEDTKWTEISADDVASMFLRKALD